MSEYVIVTNKGSCYSYMCKNSAERKVSLCCDAGTYVDGASPENGKKYKKICENEHPASPGRIVVTIEDEATGQRYVMGLGGLAPAPKKYDPSEWWSPDNGRESKADIVAKLKQKEKQVLMNDNIKLGDLVTVVKQSDSHYGELMKVVLLREYNYDYVTCLPHESTPRWGYNKGQIAKYNIEPDLSEDQKPSFSRSELIEILEQNKPAEEILLDIRDHITN